MSSREKILAAIRKNKPTVAPLPSVASFAVPDVDLKEHFFEVLKKSGARTMKLKVVEEVVALIGESGETFSPIENLQLPNNQFQKVSHPKSLKDLEWSVLEGTLGVAENGAIWITEAQMGMRGAAYITANLMVVLREDQLVWNLHQAYQKIDPEVGFGGFIAGPSKTADIEQSLVIGAHGPKSMTVVLLPKK